MPMRRALALLLLSFLALASAQSPVTQEALAEVRIEGTTAYSDIVRIVLESRPGRPLDRIDLEAERNRVYATEMRWNRAFDDASLHCEHTNRQTRARRCVSSLY
mgnify:CR=1 FL=1